MKTPREFAKRYMDSKLFLPFVTNMSGLLYLPDMPEMSELEKLYKKSGKNGNPMRKRVKLNSLERKSICPHTKAAIYSALYELTQAMILDVGSLKRLNMEFVKRRKDAIRHLKKVLRNPLLEKRPLVAQELERLMELEQHKKKYREIDFISSRRHIFYAGLFKRLVLKIEIKKTTEILSTPMSFRKDRVLQFFSEVLQIFVFRYLHEHANIPKEEAEQLTVGIITEFIEGVHPLSTMSSHGKD